jgi:hypothetical protein
MLRSEHTVTGNLSRGSETVATMKLLFGFLIVACLLAAWVLIVWVGALVAEAVRLLP